MNIMVVGSGGREHAIIKKIKENPEVEKIYALPGNGGISQDAVCVPIKTKDIDGIVDFALKNNIDFAIVAPDDPLVLGAVDALSAKMIPCFGPDKKAAEIEGSKVFSKNLMKKYNIPTAKYEIFSDMEKAISYLKQSAYPVVIKADGLALGKGVIIAENNIEATAALKKIMLDKVFGESGDRVVIEEYLEGTEVSVLAFTDGKTIKPMVSAMDHKRIYDGDKGLNTGGMGAITPNPFYTKKIADECMEKIFIPTIKAMEKEGRTFKGCLYFGLMLTKDGPKVIEYNCRFGDPETQVVLPLLNSDLFTIMKAVYDENLKNTEVEFSDESACCVVMASRGYPETYQSGYEITVKEEFNAEIFYAGSVKENKKILTSGGRVLGVTAKGKNIFEAVKNAYENIEKVSFSNSYYRKDIGKKALEAVKGKN